MSRRAPTALVAALALLLLLAAAAQAIKGSIGNTSISSTVTMQPRELPARGGAPITLSSVTRVKTRDGSPPEKLTSIEFLVDKHGRVDARGVPICSLAQLAGTTTAEARRRCRGALVGTGTVKALVSLPGQPPTPVTLPVSFFNGPKAAGQPSVIGHAHETLPAAKTLLVQVAVERVRSGRYGYRIEVGLPPIADGYGVATLAEATVGKTRKRGGRAVGYLNAFCSGGRLQVKGTLNFENGDRFPALLTSPCRVGG